MSTRAGAECPTATALHDDRILSQATVPSVAVFIRVVVRSRKRTAIGICAAQTTSQVQRFVAKSLTTGVRTMKNGST